MKKVKNLTQFTREIASLIWKNRSNSEDEAIAAARTRNSTFPGYFILLRSDISNFNPAILTLCLEAITNKDQLDLAKQEAFWLSQEVPEVAKYINLMSMIEDYEADSGLREY